MRKETLGKCQGPGKYRNGCNKEAVDIHHKDKDHSNNNPENLIRLCRGCHRIEHFDHLADYGDQQAEGQGFDLVDEINPKRAWVKLKHAEEMAVEGEYAED